MKNQLMIDALMEVYNSFISQKIDDYNSSVYYENPSIYLRAIRKRKCSNCVSKLEQKSVQGDSTATTNFDYLKEEPKF